MDARIFGADRMEWGGVQRVKALKHCLVECLILIGQVVILSWKLLQFENDWRQMMVMMKEHKM